MANFEASSTGQMDVYFNRINAGQFRLSERGDVVSGSVGDDLHYAAPHRGANRSLRVTQPPWSWRNQIRV